MGWPIYSTRILSATGPGTFTYTVPSGKLVVIKHGAFMITAAATGSADVNVFGRYCFVCNFQAQFTSFQWPTMVVAYGGENIKLGLSSASISGILSGFMFDAPGLALDKLEDLSWEPYVVPAPPDRPAPA